MGVILDPRGNLSHLLGKYMWFFFFSFMSSPLLWILKRQVLISFTILWLTSICSHFLSLNPLTSHCWQLSSRAVKFSRATIQSGAAYLFEEETYIVTVLNKVNRFFVLFCYRAGSSKPSAKRQDFIKSLKENTIKPWICNRKSFVCLKPKIHQSIHQSQKKNIKHTWSKIYHFSFIAYIYLIYRFWWNRAC